MECDTANQYVINYALLFDIYEHGLRASRWEPKMLDIDLANLKEEGLIAYDSIGDVGLTTEGRELIEGILYRMTTDSEDEEDDTGYYQ